MFPAEWSVCSVGKLFNFLGTASNSRADLEITGDTAYVHYGDIHTRFNHFIDFSRDSVPRLSADRSVAAALLRDGDLIVADASEDEAGVGKSVEVRNLGNTKAVSGLHTLLLRPRNRRTVEGYRGYLFESAFVKEQLHRLATGLKVFGVSKGALKKVLLPLPSPSEQHTIAETLSDVDGLLGALEALIAKKRAIKQAALQQLLSYKIRLPGFKEEWMKKSFGMIASVRNEKVQPSNVDGGMPCVELDHIVQRSGRLFGYAEARFSTSEKFRFYCGDVLFGRLRPYLRKFWHADRDGICTTEVWPLMVEPRKADGAFVHAVIQSERFIESASISYGTHMPRADWAIVKNFEVNLPQICEQRAIAAVLADMDTEIEALERRCDKTLAVKQGMMEQLLSGRVRLV